MQSTSKDSKEDDGCNDRLESKEVLNLGVRNAEEGKLEQKVKQESTHSLGVDTLTGSDMVGNGCIAWPDGSQQDLHTLAT